MGPPVGEQQTIGAVAERSGVPVKTIRFYCDQGLLHPVARSEGGFRLFDASVDDDLTLIRTLRGLEVPLATIARFLEARRSGLCTCAQLQATLQSKAGEIHSRIADLQALQRTIEQLLADWQACGGQQPPAGPAEPSAASADGSVRR